MPVCSHNATELTSLIRIKIMLTIVFLFDAKTVSSLSKLAEDNDFTILTIVSIPVYVYLTYTSCAPCSL